MLVAKGGIAPLEVRAVLLGPGAVGLEMVDGRLDVRDVDVVDTPPRRACRACG